MELSIQLAEAFLESPGGVFSIHQISKKLDIPYGTAYNRIHQLGKMGVIRIIPQGKAKLCTLNPPNPMAGALLALGGARLTAQVLENPSPLASVIKKVRGFLEERFRDQIHCALLLNADSLLSLKESELMLLALESAEYGGDSGGGDDGLSAISVDLFLIMADENIDLENFETNLLSTISTQYPLKVTRMVVTPSTLLGMIKEKENDAGLSAYHMLRRGTILIGFDRFFNLLLKTFGSFQF